MPREQFKEFLVRILIITAIDSQLMGEVVNASAMMAIVVPDAVLDVVQHSRAARRWMRMGVRMPLLGPIAKAC